MASRASPVPGSWRAPPGSLRGLSDVYEAHARAVYSFAYYLFGRPKADQVAQDAFVWWWTRGEGRDTCGTTQRVSLLASVYRSALREAGLSGRSQLPTQEAAVGLADFGGLARDQIATILEEPSEAVKVHIQSGTLRLRPVRSAATKEVL